MPIFGITQRGLRFPRLGTIRKGQQEPVIDRETGKPRLNNRNEAIMRPVEMPWFVFNTDTMLGEYIPEGVDERAMTKKELMEWKKKTAVEKQEHEERDYKLRYELLEEIYRVYGTNQITQLNVFLPYPEAEPAFNFWLEAYANNQLIARSDEVKITFLFDTSTSEVLVRGGLIVRHSGNPRSVAGSLVEDLPIGGVLPYEKDMVVAQAKSSGDKIGFKASGRLNIVIPELKRLATWMVITGAWSDIASIYSAVDIIGQISRVTGRPANTIPLILRRVPRQQKYEDENGKTHSSTKHYIEAQVVSDAVKGLLTAYENTPFMLQAMNSTHDERESFDEAGEVDVNWNIEIAEMEGEPPIQQNGEPPSELRPYQPEALKTKINDYADYHIKNQTKVNEKAGQVLASSLNTIFGNETDRYVFTAWIFGEGSTKSLKGSQIQALLDWLEVAHFGAMPAENAIIEAKMALTHINKLHGQQELL